MAALMGPSFETIADGPVRGSVAARGAPKPAFPRRHDISVGSGGSP